MRIHGYCDQCRRPAIVTANPHSLARGIPTGTCARCEEKERRRMPTGYEVGLYNDIGSIADSLKKIAAALEALLPTLNAIHDAVDRAAAK